MTAEKKLEIIKAAAAEGKTIVITSGRSVMKVKPKNVGVFNVFKETLFVNDMNVSFSHFGWEK